MKDLPLAGLNAADAPPQSLDGGELALHISQDCCAWMPLLESVSQMRYLAPEEVRNAVVSDEVAEGPGYLCNG